ncbi:SusD/RagB family nutrient-binding outer membrane lipoprotein [Nibrella saemangeumensis]|uniref:SusD/RagB family nutrient-binding outer membrane lipoprotein n=1 Tax=Nibrella saemangeumensis TaxID=1084526 RepID=A0ABP8NHG8_9BACT
MKKLVHKSLVLAGLLMAATACNDFGDMNVSPNNPANPNTASLLTGAMRNVGTAVTNIVPALYVQQFGDVTYIEESRYRTVNFDYNTWYAGPLNNLQYIIDLNTNPETKVAAAANGSNNNQIAIARILKAYYFQSLTDRWGDIPYSEALKGNKNFTPKFDKQQDIYNDLFKEWKEAVAQFDGGATVQGDILLGGNVARWKKFANSLRAIAALRLSKVDPAKGKAEFAAALADGVLTSNADNVTYRYLAEANNEHPLYNNYITTNRKDYAVSNTFVDYLKKTSDPRLPALAEKNINGDYVGVPYAVFPVAWTAQGVSLAASTLRQQNSPVNVVTYAQILLARAEAAKLGWTAEDPKKLYEEAIKASMEMYGVYTEAAYAAYLAQPDIAYNDAKAIEQIAMQRWIVLFYNGNEAWAEWRRTGFPVLTPAKNPFNNLTDVPRRLAYPTTESTLNLNNYNEVIARQGADVLSTRVWWDKQ